MRRRSREVSIFNLSALDVLAMATGAFVLLAVMLLPYYRKTFEANAAVEGLRVSVESLSAELDETLRAASADEAAAAELHAQAESIFEKAAAAKAAAISRRDEAASAAGRAADNERQIAELQQIVDQKVIKQLDLIFVVDTTASMTRVLRDMAFSMSGIIRVLERLVPSLRVAVVAYRDHDLRGQLLQMLPPTATDRGARQVQSFVDGLRPASRGGNTPQEALFDGLERALSLPLRASAKQSVIVIGDAASHSHQQSATLLLARRYADSGRRRSVSTLFVPTESYRRFGSGDRGFFAELAKAGRGAFNDHGGQLTESVLLSVLED